MSVLEDLHDWLFPDRCEAFGCRARATIPLHFLEGDTWHVCDAHLAKANQGWRLCHAAGYRQGVWKKRPTPEEWWRIMEWAERETVHERG